jgi:hypothetical protein
MPQPEDAIQKNDEIHSNGMNVMSLVRWLLASPKQTRRLVQWVILGALVTSALGTVANHFMGGTTADQDQQKLHQNPPDSSWNGHQANWWSGSSTTDESPSNGPGETANKASVTGSNTVSTSPTTPRASLPHFSAGAVFLRDNSVAPIGVVSQPLYFAFAGPKWMNIAPLATATRPLSKQSNSSAVSGKSSKKGQSVWESSIPVAFNTETANQNSKNGAGSSGDSSGTLTSTTGGKTIPVNHGYQLGGGELYMNNEAGASKSSEPTYALLGLSTGSASTQVSATDTSSEELHFSLEGEMTTAPTLGISDGTPVTNSIPEPATGVMVLAGAVMLVSRRRRVRPMA